jgi:hypothetical protein
MQNIKKRFLNFISSGYGLLAAIWFFGFLIVAWNWGAKLLEISGVAKWLWFLPDLAAAFLGAVGIPIHSSSYWDMNPHNLTCTPALYQLTPESIQKRYEGCIYTESASGEVINLRCRTREINAEFFYTRNLDDCNKYIEKLRVAKSR